MASPYEFQVISGVLSVMGSFEEMEVFKYGSAASLVILLYDHVLTFSDEVNFIWKAQWSMPKFLFLMNRYMIPCLQIMNAYVQSGFSGHGPSVMFCKGYIIAAVYSGMISISFSNFLVLLRLWSIWDRNLRLVHRTTAFFVLTQIGSVVTTGLVTSEIIPVLSVFPENNSCIFTKKINVFFWWIPTMIYEVMVLLVALLNALNRPRKSESLITTELFKDGAIYLASIAAMCALNIAVSARLPLSLTLLSAFFTWTVSNVTLVHLVLNCRKVSTTTTADVLEIQSDKWRGLDDRTPSTRSMSFMDGDCELSTRETWM